MSAGCRVRQRTAWCLLSPWTRKMRAAHVTFWGDVHASGGQGPRKRGQASWEQSCSSVSLSPGPAQSVREEGHLAQDLISPGCLPQRPPRPTRASGFTGSLRGAASGMTLGGGGVGSFRVRTHERHTRQVDVSSIHHPSLDPGACPPFRCRERGGTKICARCCHDSLGDGRGMVGLRNGFRSDAPRRARCRPRPPHHRASATRCLFFGFANRCPHACSGLQHILTDSFLPPGILQLSHLREGTLGSEGARSVACHVASERLTCPKSGPSLRASEDPSSLTKNTLNLTSSDEHNCE